MFILNEKHIRNGRLTGRDFSDQAGFNVPILELQHFPRRKENRAAQAKVIWAEMRGAGLDTLGFDKKHAWAATTELLHTVHWIETPIGRRPKTIYAYLNSLIGKSIEEIDAIILGKGSLFFPGLLDEKIEIGTLFKAAAAFVMRAEVDEKKLWSILLEIPEDLLRRYPNENLHRLFYEIHELRHFLQIGNDNAVTTFYAELDSDMFANAVFRRARIGAEMRRANVHFRYLCMIDAPPQYWHAPVLEALERGEKPPNFFEIHDAVMEIRFRIAMECENDRRVLVSRGRQRPQSEFPSRIVQEAIRNLKCRPEERGKKRSPKKQYAGLLKADLRIMENLYEEIPVSTKADPVYVQYVQHFMPILQKLAAEGAFEKGSLSLKLAERILEADEYFNPRPAPIPAPRFEPVAIPAPEKQPELAFI